MFDQAGAPMRLYLPLLTHHDPEVRRQACLILLGTYGERAVTALRRLLDDPDQQVRREARLGLLALVEVTDAGVRFRPPRGMYVACLGGLRVFVGNRELRPEDWAQTEGGRAGWQKVRAAFAYLVHSGRRGASRPALGAAVWGGAVSASSLARTLSALRHTLSAHYDGALMLDAEHCLLDPDSYHTDVQLFERAFDMATRVEHDQDLAAAAPLYDQAIQLYAGPYMADLPRGSGWWRERRDHLMSSFVIAAERAAEHAFTQQQYQRCADVCALALDADPSADDVVAWQLMAYGQLGATAELSHAYQAYLRAAGRDEQHEDPHDRATRTYRELVASQESGARSQEAGGRRL